jgi:hypothetical protein
VEDYIRAVGKKKHRSQIITHYMPMFMQYLVTRSWKKMRRRISHWSSQGFIYRLGQVDEIALRAAVWPAVSPLRNDVALSSRLILMDNDNTLQDVIMAMCPRTNMRSTLTSLLTACRDMQTRDGRARSGVSGLYNRATCFEFHQLLVSTLICFGKALDTYAHAYTRHQGMPDPQSTAELVNCAKVVEACGYLLWLIAYSRILEDHLKILHRNRWLALPVNTVDQLALFFQFTTFEHIQEQVVVQPTGEDDGGADEAGGDGGGGVEDGKNEDEEFMTIANNAIQSDCTNLAQTFLAWIRLQVDRWQASRKITSFMKRARTPPVDLTLLVVKHPKPLSTDNAVEPWRSTVRSLCATAPTAETLDPEETIYLLEDMINKWSDVQGANNIFQRFKTGITYKYNATIHCESAIAALDKFPDGVVGDEILKDHIRVWFHFRYHHYVCRSDALHRISTTA